MRIIQVGLGPWGLDWARQVVPSVDGVEVVGRADGDAAARSEAMETLKEPVSLYHASLAEALAAARCDAVLATVPLAGHAAVVREALSAGCHVLVEKPFAESVAEAAELVALAKSRNRVLMVSQNYRHFPAPLAVAELVADRRLGAVRSVDLDFRHDAESLGYRYYHLAQPLLSDMSIHHFDLMRMVLGAEPISVSCKTVMVDGTQFAGPPVAEATFSFAGDITVRYAGSWVSKDAPTDWAGTWNMEFENADVWWTSRAPQDDPAARDRVIVRGDGVDQSSPELKPPAQFDRAGCLAAFRDTVRSGREPPFFSSGADNINSLAMVEAAVRSAAIGQSVRIAEIIGSPM